ncbi:inactive sodium-dependent neutral amino acid transporter B(0)AT3 isoform X1 [Anas platyrhynchos]|uniref:inactive sodium-dependent neutral amino acid transporter B(0)AT3 isoform X1 n=1 Tax=Anas platyrhynchos TaxID=8839 RepID=UPI000F7C8374|nr:sodium-dependent neutral amino acid transporter B(0)AT3 [Anas platyrhynchos]|eukprot:XP_027306008.1 sodium-dependent neutral amino acid transporter B(0)AT3 [Anas platyrhynchos]
MSKDLPVDMPPEAPKEDSRPKWDNKLQYILSCIGFAVGLGNVWRFPYLCQIHGGGAFLIPYFIALIFEGIPLLHLELALGQCLRKGSISAWSAISPYLGGVGVGSWMVSVLVSLYYNTVLTWVMWYFINSFQEPLPWSVCPLNENRTGLNEECYESTAVNYFWYRKTLNITPDITESGTLQWWLVLCLAACWAIVYLCTIRGIETTGKAIYVTAIFPYLVLTIFLIHGLTLPGATEGLAYLFTPDLKVLKNPRVWLDAATQIFFSLSLAFGGLIAFSSYNPPKNDCEKDAVTVAIVNSLTSLYASIPVFSVLGFKATTGYWDCLDRNIISIINEFDLPEQSIMRENYTDWITFLNSSYPEKIAGLKLKSCDLQEFLDQSVSGSGLAFIVFTQAIILMPGSQAWAILFFTMLFSLGLSSMFGNIEGVFTPLLELQIISKSIPKELLSGIICLVSFLIALCFTLSSGSYWIDIFDRYAGSVPLLVIAFFEVTGVVYVYKIKRFSEDVKWMTGRKLNLYWQITWRFISPLLLLIVFVAFVTLQIQKPPTYTAWNPKHEDFPMKEEKAYPPWVQAICVLLAVLPCIFVPLVALFQLVKKMWRSKDPSFLPPEVFSCQEVNRNFSHPKK